MNKFLHEILVYASRRYRAFIRKQSTIPLSNLHIVHFFFSTVAAYMANEVVYKAMFTRACIAYMYT